MIVHVSIFSIFLFSAVIYAVVPRYVNKDYDEIAFIFYIICSSTTQVMTCYIFWNMDNIQFVPVSADRKNDEEEVDTEEVIEEVRVERIDSEFDL